MPRSQAHNRATDGSPRQPRTRANRHMAINDAVAPRQRPYIVRERRRIRIEANHPPGAHRLPFRPSMTTDGRQHDSDKRVGVSHPTVSACILLRALSRSRGPRAEDPAQMRLLLTCAEVSISSSPRPPPGRGRELRTAGLHARLHRRRRRRGWEGGVAPSTDEARGSITYSL